MRKFNSKLLFFITFGLMEAMHENFSIVLIVNIGNDKIAKKLDITEFEISQMLTLMQRSSKHLIMADILIL